MTIAVVSHDYDFLSKVVTDVVHYDNGGVPEAPCRLEYYPMGFEAFQKLKPEIASGLPKVRAHRQAHVLTGVAAARLHLSWETTCEQHLAPRVLSARGGSIGLAAVWYHLIW